MKIINWWLKTISRDQFLEVYAGTPAIDLMWLFEHIPDSDEEYFAKFFTSKMFRMNSGVYKIINKKGQEIRFSMNYAQHVVYAAHLRHPRLIVLKSRQQGISTLWLLSYIDDIVTRDNFTAGLMAQDREAAGTLLERVTVALEGLEEKVVQFLGVSVVKNNESAISFTNGSMLFIRTSFRSGTLQRLHISEFGKIAAIYPKKAAETKSGSLQTIAPGNTVVIESTAEGRKNEFYNMWHEAVDFVGLRTDIDFSPVFLSWVDDPDCQLNVPQVINREAEEYFIKTAREVAKMKGMKGLYGLSEEQKWWWVTKQRELRELVFQEYPATPDEAFASVRDGSYYAVQYKSSVVENKREVSNLYDPKLPVFAASDLGRNDMWVTVYFQVFHNLSGKTEFRFIGEYHNTGESIEHYVDEARERPWKLTRWYLPHDAKVTDLSAKKSRLKLFQEYGAPAKALRKASSRENDVSIVRHMIKEMWIDVDECQYLIDAFYNYSRKWDTQTGTWRNEHLHDEWSNPADAIRYAVMGFASQLRSEDSSEERIKTRKKRRKAGREGAVAV